MRRVTRYAIVPLFLVWLFAVLTFFFWGHQFNLIPPVLGLLRAGWPMLGAGLVLLTALGAGRLLAAGLRLNFASGVETATYSLGLGLGAMSLVTLGLGLAGWLRPILFQAGGLIGAIATLAWLIRRRRAGRDVASPSPAPWTRFDRFLMAILAVYFLAGLLLALIPPLGWDGLSTHLLLVRRALESGRLLAEPEFARPLAGHMLYIWGMAIAGDGVPQLLSYSLAGLMAAAVGAEATRRLDRRVGLLAATILFSVEVLVLTAVWPYADTPTGWFGLLAILAGLRWATGRDAGRPGWLVAAALFAALAAHSKLNGLFVLPPLLAIAALGLWWGRPRWRSLTVQLGLAGTAGVVLALAYTLAENSLQSAAANDLARVADSAGVVGEQLLAAGDPLARARGYLQVIWDMTVIGQQGGRVFDGTITPLFLILMPLLLFLPGKGRYIALLSLAALLEFAAWLLLPKGYYQSRHLIMAYPLFSLLAAYVVYRLPELDRPSFTLSGFFRIILVLVLGVQALFYFGWLAFYDPAPYVLGLQSRDSYLLENLNGGTTPGYYSTMLALNDAVADDAVVGFAHPEPRLYYCQARCSRLGFSSNGDPSEYRAQARAGGLDYLLVSWQGIAFFQEFYRADPVQLQNWLTYETMLRQYLGQDGELILSEQGFSLYRLARPPES